MKDSRILLWQWKIIVQVVVDPSVWELLNATTKDWQL